MNLLRSVLAWLHRSWVLRLLEPLFFPGLVLFHSIEHMDGQMPRWLLVTILTTCLLWVIATFLGHHLARTKRPRRDRSRPILEQVSNDLREDVPLEERAGLRRIPQPPPPRALAAFIRSFGRRLPKIADAIIFVLLLGSIVVSIGNAIGFEGMSLNQILASLRLLPSDLSRWDVALISSAVFALTSLRSWTSARRAELDGETEPRPLEAYG